MITTSFLDEDSVAVIPTSILWSLSDLAGNIINEREDIDFEVDNGLGTGGTLAATIEIILTGDDLQIAVDNDTVTRRLVIKALYDSSLGTGLKLKNSCEFEVENLASVV